MKHCTKLTSVVLLITLTWLISAVFAAEGAGSVPPQSLPVSPQSLSVLGFIFGYFLTYSIRYGSKTQDVFKGFLGLSGAIGGTTGLAFVLKDSNQAAAALVAYGWGTVYGFATYLFLALVLACVYSWTYTYKKDAPVTGFALAAETLGKILLGEDLRPPLSK